MEIKEIAQLKFKFWTCLLPVFRDYSESIALDSLVSELTHKPHTTKT